MCQRKTHNILVRSQNRFLPSEETNCPMALDPPRLFSWNWTSETMMLSSSTDPQPIQTASPRAWSMSISLPPQFEQTCDIILITLLTKLFRWKQLYYVQKGIAIQWFETRPQAHKASWDGWIERRDDSGNEEWICCSLGTLGREGGLEVCCESGRLNPNPNPNPKMSLYRFLVDILPHKLVLNSLHLVRRCFLKCKASATRKYISYFGSCCVWVEL